MSKQSYECINFDRVCPNYANGTRAFARAIRGLAHFNLSGLYIDYPWVRIKESLLWPCVCCSGRLFSEGRCAVVQSDLSADMIVSPIP